MNSAEKVRLAGNQNVMVCERGTMFGYSKFISFPCLSTQNPFNIIWFSCVLSFIVVSSEIELLPQVETILKKVIK